MKCRHVQYHNTNQLQPPGIITCKHVCRWYPIEERELRSIKWIVALGYTPFSIKQKRDTCLHVGIWEHSVLLEV